METKSSSPLVTLGMPVYNEALYIRQSLENLREQSYPNLEILIFDNASTDGTSEICAEFAAKDKYVRHIRHPKNLGQHANFNRLPRSASGTYFCWVSGHDLLEPDFTEKCVAVLQNDPACVLAYPRTINMRKDGTVTREKVRPFDIRAMSPARRFLEVMWRVDCNYVYGMWRLQPMLESNLFQVFPASDRVFLAEMAIKGTFAPVDTFKYYRMSREHVQTELEKRHRIMGYLHPDRSFTDKELSGNGFYAPTLHGFREVAHSARFSLVTRLRISLSIWLCGVMKFHLFPGADALSALAKHMLPKRVTETLLRQMQ